MRVKNKYQKPEEWENPLAVNYVRFSNLVTDTCVRAHTHTRTSNMLTLTSYALVSPSTPHHTHITLCTRQSFEIAYGRFADYFDAFIIFIIIVAGVLVGIQTYPEFECPAGERFGGIDDDDFIQKCKHKWGGAKDTLSIIFGDGGIADLYVCVCGCVGVWFPFPFTHVCVFVCL